MAAQAAGIVGSEFPRQSWVEKAKTEFSEFTNFCPNELDLYRHACLEFFFILFFMTTNHSSPTQHICRRLRCWDPPRYCKWWQRKRSVCGAGPWHRRSWAEHRTEKLERYNGFPDLSQNFLNFIIGKGLHALNWVLHSLILKPMVVITPIMWLTPHWYPEHFQSWESWDVNGVNCGDLSITKKSGIVLGCGEFTKPGFLYHVCKAWFSTWNIKVEILRTRLCAKQPTFLMVGSANGAPIAAAHSMNRISGSFRLNIPQLQVHVYQWPD